MLLIIATLFAMSPFEDRIKNVELPNPDGSTYRYAILSPKKHNGEEKLPLVLALHYGGQVSPFYGRSFMELLVAPAFKNEKVIIVAPDCPGRGWGSPEAQAYIPKLLDHLQARYPINQQRVLVGFSMGAHGAWYWAAEKPGAWTAAIALAGRVPDKVSPGMEQTPFYVIHSRDDELIPLMPSKANADKLKAQGMPVTFKAIKGLTHYQTQGYVDYLRSARKWLREHLKDDAK